MTQQRPLLVATDLSESARLAAERAALLARDAGCALHLVHAVDDGALADLRRWWSGPDGDAVPDIDAGTQQQLQALAAQLSGMFGIAVQAHLERGRPVPAAVALGERLGAELIAVGTRGAQALRRMTIGSTAERLLMQSQRPVLLVRRGAPEAYRRVLVPVDFSAWSATAVATARRVAPGAQLVLLHTLEVPLEGRLRSAGVAEGAILRCRQQALAEASANMQQLIAGCGLDAATTRTVLVDGNHPWVHIVEAEQSQSFDLVVIGKQGRHALEDALVGSTTRMVIAESTCDVLMCPQHPAPH